MDSFAANAIIVLLFGIWGFAMFVGYLEKGFNGFMVSFLLPVWVPMFIILSFLGKEPLIIVLGKEEK